MRWLVEDSKHERWEEGAMSRPQWPKPAAEHARCRACRTVFPGEQARHVGADGRCDLCVGRDG